MMSDKHPLSDLVVQGWEISGFSTAYTGTGTVHTVLLKKNRQHKIALIRKPPLLGVSLEEFDV